MIFVVDFFFSSRRRHTRYIGDWSSDVCSSDLAASATACMAPTRVFNWHQRPLPSVESASARFTTPVLGSLMRITAASLAPGPARVLVRTEVSYCSVTQRLEAIADDARSLRKFGVRSVPLGANENQF